MDLFLARRIVTLTILAGKAFKMWKNRKTRNFKIGPLPLRSWIWEGGVAFMED